MSKSLSLIVPFFNENKIFGNYKILSAFLQENIPNYELILVNDGSTQESYQDLEKAVAKDKKASYIYYSPNQGRGYAVKKGFEKARGDYIAYIDADLEISPTYLIEIVRLLKKYDVVIATKFHKESKVISPLMRKVSSKVFNSAIRLGLGSKIKDHQIGLKGFRKNVIDAALPYVSQKRWLFDVELLYLIQKKKYSIIEIPVSILYGFKKVRSSFVVDFLKLFIIMYIMRSKHRKYD